MKDILPRCTFAIISHPDAGKTTVTEKILWHGQVIRTAGKVKAKDGSFAKSDWMAVSDRTPTDAQKTYRQALRDLPANQTPSDMQLSNITWPTEPS